MIQIKMKGLKHSGLKAKTNPKLIRSLFQIGNVMFEYHMTRVVMKRLQDVAWGTI